MIKWSKVSPLISHCRETPPLLTRAIEYTPSCMTVGWQEKIFLVHSTDFKIFHVIFNLKHCFCLNVMFFAYNYLIEFIISQKLCICIHGVVINQMRLERGERFGKKSHNITRCGGGGYTEISLLFIFRFEHDFQNK